MRNIITKASWPLAALAVYAGAATAQEAPSGLATFFEPQDATLSQPFSITPPLKMDYTDKDAPEIKVEYKSAPSCLYEKGHDFSLRTRLRQEFSGMGDLEREAIRSENDQHRMDWLEDRFEDCLQEKFFGNGIGGKSADGSSYFGGGAFDDTSMALSPNGLKLKWGVMESKQGGIDLYGGVGTDGDTRLGIQGRFILGGK